MHRLAWMFVAAIGTVLAFAFPATSMSPSAGNRVVLTEKGRGYPGGAGGGAYEGKRGSFDVTWEGTSVGLNALVSVLSGTWRITDGTGVYKAWKGGGRFVVVEREPSAGLNTYEARWEGLVRR
jgi:hypothetical protein